jgi:hypothetical protein
MTFVRAARIFQAAMPWSTDARPDRPHAGVGRRRLEARRLVATLIDPRQRRIVEGLQVSASAVM